MKVQDIFEQREEYYGLVVSHDRATGNFEDIKLVDFATDNILDGQPSHAHDMMDKLIQIAKRTNMFGSIESILKRNSRQTKELGPEFDDTENFVTTKYGPYTAGEIGQLADKLAEV